MTVILLSAGFSLLAAIWTAIWGWTLLGASGSTQLSRSQTNAAFFRERLIYASGVAVVAVLAASIYWLPYVLMLSSTTKALP